MPGLMTGISPEWWALILVGLVAGCLSGLLGVGSGVVTVPALVLLFTIPQKCHELMDDHMNLALVIPQCLDTRKHVRYRCDMVGAEYVEDQIESTYEFLTMVCDIGQAIGRLSGAFDDHPVLLQTEVGRFQPDRSILIIRDPLLPERLDDLFDLAA